LPSLQDWKRLDDSVSQRCKKVRPVFARRFQHVAREITMVRALLYNDEAFCFAEPFPHFCELRCQQSPKKRTDTHIREVIAAPPNRALARRIISVLRMIERLFHEPGKGLRAAILNLVANELDQSAISSLRPQRPTFNAQLSTLNCQNSLGMLGACRAVALQRRVER